MQSFTEVSIKLVIPRFVAALNGVSFLQDPVGLALVGTINHDRVENNPYTGGEPWPAYSLELVGEVDISKLRFSGNIGHRWRNSGDVVALDGEFPIEPYDDQLLYSLGAEWRFYGDRLSALAEIYGNYTDTDNIFYSPRNASVMEGVVGIRYKPTPELLSKQVAEEK